ncbi:MAG: riboflavin synthase [Chloroflexales bacterium]|nr:riboflavin synthase [Chloroflexales bacterium]
MFTGIVEEIGCVRAVIGDRERDNTLMVDCRVVLEGTRLGDSIAINGACLTVTALTNDSFTVGLSPETLRRTNLGRLQQGDGVNLERALAFGGRMSGHYVEGHVDGVGEIVAIAPDGEAKYVTIRPPAPLLRYIVEKGYIAVDGVSLTVAALDATTFSISLIAHTQQAVIMGRQVVGAPVNLEVDIIAKYAERLVEPYHSPAIARR